MTSVLKKRCDALLSEFMPRLGYSAISALSIIVILLIVRMSDMPMADIRINVVTVLSYAVAAMVSHVAADIVSYIVVGFSTQRVLAWQGSFNFILAIVVTGLSFAYIDSLTPGNTIVIGNVDDGGIVQMWIIAMMLACVVAAITASFERSSGKRRRLAEIDNWCASANQSISCRNLKRKSNSREIFMDQFVRLSDNSDHSPELAVCDMVYAHRIDSGRMSISYCVGNKTCRMAFDGTIPELMHAFERYKQVAQCHKDYVVNIDRIVCAKRDDDGHCVLRLRGTKHVIPVAERYSGDLYRLLADENHVPL